MVTKRSSTDKTNEDVIHFDPLRVHDDLPTYLSRV